MPTIAINGGTIYYQEVGSGPTVVFTAGGRWSGDYHQRLAELLSPHFRVITWDRRNCGRSSIYLEEGPRMQAEVSADDLAELVVKLGVGPVYVGEYAGCRTSPIMVFKHPELVKGLLLGWCSGGPVATRNLGSSLHGQFVTACEKGGMEAVVEVPFILGGFDQNPKARETLLATDPNHFLEVMRRWYNAFLATADLPIAGMPLTDQEVASIKVPTVIVSGDDDVHSLEIARKMHRLIGGSEFHEPPIPDEKWTPARGTPRAPVLQAEAAAPIFRDFIRRVEES